MQIYRVLPRLEKVRQMRIWHNALRSQWSAEDLAWKTPQRITSDRLKDELARMLTPILMGEQAALYSVSGLIPVLGRRNEVESQFYLTTWAVDEARHTELFTRFYGRLGREPMPIKRFRSGYYFQSAIVSQEPAEWLAGVLVSEVLAKQVLMEFRELDLDPVLSEICHGILKDEARHLGFNHIYMEDRFRTLLVNGEPDASARAQAQHLESRLDAVLSKVSPIFDELDSEMKSIRIDREALLYRVGKEARQRLAKAIGMGRTLAERAKRE
jgi:hypothetical protein